jgi:catechol 2,3-dioxygenase-like lactoylglutathione lyase family enzyme
MEQRVSVITLGVADVSRAQAFYEALGWKTDAGVDDESDHIAFFQTGGSIVSLWDRGKLAEDGRVTDGGGWGGVTLSYCVGSPDEVEAVLAEAKAAGATITRAGGKMFWGGYSGVFVDPDGHPWEVAHNPSWTLREDGSVSLR